MIRQITDSLWHWTARHPEWHPRTEFGAEVGCYLAHEGGRTVLVDPLLTEDLGSLISGEVVVAVTLPYHVRDAAQAVRLWGGVVSGHPDVVRKLPDGTPFDSGAGLSWHPLPRGKERALLVTGGLAFGDRIVGADGGLRYWAQRAITPERAAYFHRTTAPGLRFLLELEFEHALVTHGPPVVGGARQALADALEAEPWYHRPS